MNNKLKYRQLIRSTSCKLAPVGGVVGANAGNNAIKNNEWQRKNSNVMSYYSSMLPLPDFYSWQIPIIRARINEQINK